MTKARAWEWEDGAIGVRGANTLEEAYAAIRRDVTDDPIEEILDGLTMKVWAVPAAYFRTNAGESWGAVGDLPDISSRPGKGYVKVLWFS